MYRDHGIEESDIEALVEVMCDKSLHESAEENKLWAPVHAWRALAQLKAEQMMVPLIDLFGYLSDDDYAMSDVPQVFSLIGPQAIRPLGAYLLDKSNPEFACVLASDSLSRVALKHSDSRDDVLEILADCCDHSASNTYALNGLLICNLIDLKAKELIGSIRALFENNNVDITVCGDLEDVDLELGLRTKRSTPRPRYGQFQFADAADEDLPQQALHDMLNKHELVVEQALEDYGSKNSIQTLCELDGYFAAIASAPVVVMPSQWQPALWGGEVAAPIWASMDQLQDFTDAIMSIYNSVMGDIAEGYYMADYFDSVDDDVSISLHQWCRGYMRGYKLWKDKSELSLLAAAELSTHIKYWSGSTHQETFDRSSDEFAEQMYLVEGEFNALLQQFRPELSQPVTPVYNPVPDNFNITQPYVRSHLKISRNDPCFCGSGKKYKRCCLH